MDPHRKKFGLKTFAELRAPDGGEKENLLIQQKTETVDALSKIAQPCNGVPEVRTVHTAKRAFSFVQGWRRRRRQ